MIISEVIGVVTVIVATFIFLLYCYELKNCCEVIGIESGILCWIPFLNKFKLIELCDFEQDNKMVLPLFNVLVSRDAVSFVAVASICLSAADGIFIGMSALLVFISNYVIWDEIGYELDKDRKERIFWAVACSVFGFHAPQWYRLFKLRKLWSSEDYPQEISDEEQSDSCEQSDSYSNEQSDSCEHSVDEGYQRILSMADNSSTGTSAETMYSSAGNNAGSRYPSNYFERLFDE